MYTVKKESETTKLPILRRFKRRRIVRDNMMYDMLDRCHVHMVQYAQLLKGGTTLKCLAQLYRDIDILASEMKMWSNEFYRYNSSGNPLYDTQRELEDVREQLGYNMKSWGRNVK